MPHVTIRHFPKSLTDEQRSRLVELVTTAVREAFEVEEEVISLALVPVAPEDWDVEVHRPEIVAHPERLVKAPGHRTAPLDPHD
ncbi:tautomerase family protein [Streptomyces sp. NRRL S-37]|uniref:tautomerase family protein n=1 Tax=Streptomyces sp. NRRL S-37 TaxID=1463903 RepID=UPI0004C4AD00|nr:tautomerase family protein [Streptomyces sp. NRRL S-37]